MSERGQQKPKRGDRLRLSADFTSGLVDMLTAYDRNRLPQAMLGRPDLSDEPLSIVNATGQTLGRYSVVCFGEVKVNADSDEFKNQRVIEAIEPEADKLHQFAIVQDGGEEGAVLECIAVGVTQVRVNVTDESHGYAQAVSGSIDALESCGYGPAEIIWREGDTGEQWAYVRLAPLARQLRWVKCTTTPTVTSYPTAGNVMPVEFGKYAISGALSSLVGSYMDPTWESYDTPQYSLAVDPQKRFWASGAYARVQWLDGQWQFERANHVVKAEASSTITAGSSGTANVKINGATAYSVTVHYDWITSGGNIASGTDLLIQWFDDQGQWVVVGAECGT